MHVTLDHLSERERFNQIGEREPTMLEKHLRFIYAAYSLGSHIDGNYRKSRIDVGQGSIMHTASKRTLYFPKSGKPGVLVTNFVTGAVNIIKHREFQRDPLYEKFRMAVANPVQSIEIDFESVDTEYESGEFNRLVGLFDSACNNSAWESHLPKFI